ncbi:ribonuclease [Stakelama sp. CBK3Z-3]|uniref:Ribonuclease n=1 Tax=Stakelama flava TaxID=2860338 RepID=A0ABS6XLN9_9SPHN|nr:ribonuclease [Stakelama flava]MBW4331090.1 ribonuclease [Stakelama flava]
MAEWLVERGIGETRAALVDGDSVLEARILPDAALVAGTVAAARLARRIPARNQGIAIWEDGEALVTPLPRDVTEGARFNIEITRPPIPEPGKPKRALARPTDAPPGAAPPLEQALDGPVRQCDWRDTDRLERAGWSELLEEAESGIFRFPGGEGRIALTTAMTLIDIDGDLAPADLALAGARAAAMAVRRLDIGGSIGIDLPTLADKATRHACAAAIDAVLPQPFERTAVNGFGFVQIVRRRARLSLPELYAQDAVLAHARALIRRAERSTGAGERTLHAHPNVIYAIDSREDWAVRLSERLGAPVALRADPALAISAGHVQARFP